MIGIQDVEELYDKIIASTAQYLKIPIITKDKILQNLSSVRII